MYDDIAPIPHQSLQRPISPALDVRRGDDRRGTHRPAHLGGAPFIAPLLAVAAVMFSVNTCLNLALLLDPKGWSGTRSRESRWVQLGF